VPVWVGRARAQAAQGLCAAYPEVNVLVCDDGLQHHALARDIELWVFDDRGAGNGLLLPAGPLREALPHRTPPRAHVLYTGQHISTALPGPVASQQADHAVRLADWWAGGAVADMSNRVPLSALRGRPLLAVAGIAAPQKFFRPMQAAGLSVQCLPQPDHARYDTLPWPANGTPVEVITTEKDAVKLHPQRLNGAQVWVVPLDLKLPQALLDQILTELAAAAAQPSFHAP
jgi:tetraacyldisaccharide 4'-kinase